MGIGEKPFPKPGEKALKSLDGGYGSGGAPAEPGLSPFLVGKAAFSLRRQITPPDPGAPFLPNVLKFPASIRTEGE